MTEILEQDPQAYGKRSSYVYSREADITDEI